MLELFCSPGAGSARYAWAAARATPVTTNSITITTARMSISLGQRAAVLGLGKHSLQKIPPLLQLMDLGLHRLHVFGYLNAGELASRLIHLVPGPVYQPVVVLVPEFA